MYKKVFFLYFLFTLFVAAAFLFAKDLFAQQSASVLPPPQADIFSFVDPILPGLPDMPKPTATPTILPTVAPTASQSATPNATPEVKSEAIIHVPVLMYHYIRNMYNPEDKMGLHLSVTPDLFREQLGYLKDHGFNTITPQQLYDAIYKQRPLPSKPILLTFDDGYADFFIEAKPIFEQFRDNVTLFVPSDLVGKPQYLSWDQLKILAKNPQVTIAGHTRTHAHLPDISLPQAEDEIVQGRGLLQQKLGLPINFFAYPYGAFNEKIVELVQKAGYNAAFSTIGGAVHSDHDRFHLKRLTVDGTTGMAGFIQLVGQ